MARFSFRHRGLLLAVASCVFLVPARARLTQNGDIGGSNLTSGSLLGQSVAISADGSTAVAGAPGFNPGSNPNGGGVWVSTRSGSSWDAAGTLLPYGTGGSNGAQQGFAVAISGDGKTIAVGGPADGGGSQAGAVWFYTGGGETFSQQGGNFGGSSGENFGASLALSSDGNTALVGAPGSNSVYVIGRSGGSWSFQATLHGASSAAFGTSVTISADGNTALVGDPTSSGSTGTVWMFTRSGTTWSSGTQLPLGTPSISNGRQGLSVSISANGQRALVAGYNFFTRSGSVWVFSFSNGVWSQEANLGLQPVDSVSIAGDGNSAVAGAANAVSGLGRFWGYVRSVNSSTQAVTWSSNRTTTGSTGYNCGASIADSGDGNNAILGCPGAGGVGFAPTEGAPDLTVAMAHNGTFHRGDTGDTYTITVSNTGSQNASGSTTLTIGAMPSGLTATALSGGEDWTCDVGSLTCISSSTIVPAGSFNAITLTVNVAGSAPSVLSVTATVSGGFENNTTNDNASDLVTLPAAPDLTVGISHSGVLFPGRTNVPYTIQVSNTGNGPTDGSTVTVTDVLPATLVNLNANAAANIANGWTCSGATTLICTRQSVLSSGAAYPQITFFVDIWASAPASPPGPRLANTATVSGGGEVNTANDSVTDSARVSASGPDLTVFLTHTAIFTRGQQATYWVAVQNAGSAATSGTVTMTLGTMATGLTVTGLSGLGWTCNVGTRSCTRKDPLAAGLSYRVIAVTVSVGGNTPNSVTNTASVSGGGDSSPSNNSGYDVVAVTGTGIIPTSMQIAQ